MIGCDVVSKDDYFDEIDYDVDDDDEFDEEIDEEDDDDEVDYTFSDGVRSKNDIEFESYEVEEIDEEDLKKEKQKKEEKKKAPPRETNHFNDKKMSRYDEDDEISSFDNRDMSSYDDREDLSLSQLEKKTKHRKKNSKVLAIFLILAVSMAAIAILVTYSIFQRDSAPSIRTVHIESDNTEDPTIARYGNMITLTFTFNKNIEGLPVVIIRGKEVEVFGGGDSFNAMYFVQEQGMDDELVSFTIRDYVDSFKKSGIPVTSTTDGSKVVIPKYD